MEEKEIVTIKEKEEKKSGVNKVLIVIIVILLLIIAVGFGYFLGTGNLSSDEKEDEKVNDESKEEKEEEVEQLTKDSPVVKKLFEIFREDSYPKAGIWNSTVYSDFEKKMAFVYFSIDESEFVTKKCGDLGNTYSFDKTNFIYHCGTDLSDKAYDYYYEENWEKFGNELVNNTVPTISSDKLRTIYESIFGKDSTYKDENLSLSYNLFLYYDANSKSYAKFNCQCGGEIGSMIHVIDDITQDKTKLILHTTLESYDSTTKLDYTFEYEKETGNYIFVSRIKK